jgi:hypothetical protein
MFEEPLIGAVGLVVFSDLLLRAWAGLVRDLPLIFRASLSFLRVRSMVAGLIKRSFP